MQIFEEKLKGLWRDFGKGGKMVLSTAENNRVSSRMMSVVRIEDAFYFQTDRNMRKYRQISANPNVALCADNLQVEGVCEEIGHPLAHPAFCSLFSECFPSAYRAYTALRQERLFVVRPRYIERWIYQNDGPFLEQFSMADKQYIFEKYAVVSEEAQRLQAGSQTDDAASSDG